MRKKGRCWHCVKSVHIGSYSGQSFPAFGIYRPENTEQINPNTDTFHAVWSNALLNFSWKVF